MCEGKKSWVEERAAGGHTYTISLGLNYGINGALWPCESSLLLVGVLQADRELNLGVLMFGRL